jgi:hypothetical protein
MLDFSKLTPDEIELLLGVLYAFTLIKSQTSHGSIHINIVDGKVSEIDMEQRIRPQIAAPWRPKK